VKTKLFNLLIVMSVSGLWGCARSKSVETASTETQPAVDSSPVQPPAADPKPGQIPAPISGPTAKPGAAPVNSPKIKPTNENATQPDALAHKESKVAPKEEPVESKPAEMKVANGFEKNPYLSSGLKPLLPPRTSVTAAAAGFKKQRDFIAVLHLSRNLVIPFDQIKIRVTGEHRMSLNDSLRSIRPSITKSMAKAEVNKAEQQAKDDENHAKDEAKKAAAQEKVANNRKS